MTSGAYWFFALFFSYLLYFVCSPQIEKTETEPMPFETNTTTTSENLFFNDNEVIMRLSITEDGQLEINGVAIDRMSDEEIKKTMRELSEWLRKQNYGGEHD